MSRTKVIIFIFFQNHQLMNGPAHCTISDDGLVHDVTYVLSDEGTPEPKPLLLMASPMLTAASSHLWF